MSLRHLARMMCVSRDDLALFEIGACDPPVSALIRALDALDLDWPDFYGQDVAPSVSTHHVSLTSDAWHAMEGGLQLFDVRRDNDRYRVGDQLVIHEKVGNRASGRVLVMEIVYRLPLTAVELLPGYVALGLRRVDPQHEMRHAS